MIGRIALIGSLLGLLIGAVVVSSVLWTRFDDPAAPMSGMGVAMMWLGIGVSLLVGVGLMGMVFWSARSGHDDRIN